MHGSTGASDQRRRYQKAIGRGTPIEMIDEVFQFARDANLPNWYSNKDADFWYEMLDKPGLNEKVGAIADAWVLNEANVERASTHVGRRSADTSIKIIQKFGFCRFKAAPDSTGWYFLEGGPGVDEKTQTMVFIALEDLDTDNGFPFKLLRGEDVCMDGNVELWTPPSGGGHAICISLAL